MIYQMNAKKNALTYIIRSNKMNKIIIIFLTIFFISLYLFTSPCKRRVEFCSIEYPKVIVIQKKSFLKLEKKLNIKYKYYGKDIISNDGEYGHFSYMQTYSIKGNILYYDKVGKILPETHRFFKQSGFDGFQRHGGIEGSYTKRVFFKDKGLYSFDIYILSPFIFESTDVDEFIMKEKLSEILISIDEVKIYWDLIDQFHNKGKERSRKGEFLLKVNKKIKIRINYEDEGKCDNAIEKD